MDKQTIKMNEKQQELFNGLMSDLTVALVTHVQRCDTDTDFMQQAFFNAYSRQLLAAVYASSMANNVPEREVFESVMSTLKDHFEARIATRPTVN